MAQTNQIKTKHNILNNNLILYKDSETVTFSKEINKTVAKTRAKIGKVKIIKVTSKMKIYNNKAQQEILRALNTNNQIKIKINYIAINNNFNKIEICHSIMEMDP